ncbi:MAG TPA: adenosylmethionine decarboxylase [Burkholderiaceae bacterium]|nr:adenosylmethionine decarboxylase [Burkholderiaceae bacterium]
MKGLHIMAELHGCRCDTELLTDASRLRPLAEGAVKAAGLQALDAIFHTFPPHQGQPGGVTGTVLLAESHLALHTWPELAAVTLDAYVCNLTEDNSAKAHALVDRLAAAFAPLHTEKRAIHRGELTRTAPPAL